MARPLYEAAGNMVSSVAESHEAVIAAATAAGIQSQTTWKWPEAMVERLHQIEQTLEKKDGVDLQIKITWERCEQVSTWPFSHLDWVKTSDWKAYEAPDGFGFPYGDTTSILLALPGSIADAMATLPH
jgi:hypothetical protein